jgi:hypothetical protein
VNIGRSIYFSYETIADIIIPKSAMSWDYHVAIKELLIYKANHGELYSDMLVTLFIDGSYEFKYWYDEERLKVRI